MMQINFKAKAEGIRFGMLGRMSVSAAKEGVKGIQYE
jgi:hypothetical protein